MMGRSPSPIQVIPLLPILLPPQPLLGVYRVCCPSAGSVRPWWCLPQGSPGPGGCRVGCGRCLGGVAISGRVLRPAALPAAGATVTLSTTPAAGQRSPCPRSLWPVKGDPVHGPGGRPNVTLSPALPGGQMSPCPYAAAVEARRKFRNDPGIQAEGGAWRCAPTRDPHIAMSEGAPCPPRRTMRSALPRGRGRPWSARVAAGAAVQVPGRGLHAPTSPRRRHKVAARSPQGRPLAPPWQVAGGPPGIPLTPREQRAPRAPSPYTLRTRVRVGRPGGGSRAGFGRRRGRIWQRFQKPTAPGITDAPPCTGRGRLRTSNPPL